MKKVAKLGSKWIDRETQKKVEIEGFDHPFILFREIATGLALTLPCYTFLHDFDEEKLKENE